MLRRQGDTAVLGLVNVAPLLPLRTAIAPVHSQAQPSVNPSPNNCDQCIHPRVRALYKEYMTLAQHHPTFSVDKCRTKIKEGFRRNADVIIYDSELASNNDGGNERAISGEHNTTGSGSSGTSHTQTDDDNGEASHDNQHRSGRGYTAEFMKALAWGRYGLKDLEALIYLHKYRAMRARYGWEAQNEEEGKSVPEANPKKA